MEEFIEFKCGLLGDRSPSFFSIPNIRINALSSNGRVFAFTPIYYASDDVTNNSNYRIIFKYTFLSSCLSMRYKC